MCSIARADDGRLRLSAYAGLADVYEEQNASRNGPAFRVGAYYCLTKALAAGTEVGYCDLGSDYTGCSDPGNPDCPQTYGYSAAHISIGARLEPQTGRYPCPYMKVSTGFYRIGYQNQIRGVELDKESALGFSTALGVYRIWLLGMGVEAEWHTVRDTGGVLEGPGSNFYTLMLGVNLKR